MACIQTVRVASVLGPVNYCIVLNVSAKSIPEMLAYHCGLVRVDDAKATCVV
jgi:hypothetical protein